MNCPKCGHGNNENAVECSRCGLIFSKWRARQQVQNQSNLAEVPSPVAPSRGEAPSIRIPKWLVVLLVLGVAVSFPRYFSSGDKDAPQKAQSTSTAPPNELAAAPARMDLPLERVDGILAEMNAQGAAYGIQFTREDLRNYFEGGRTSNLTPGYLNTVEEKAGLTEPRRVELSSGEGKKISENNFLLFDVKYKIDGEWSYAKSIPKTQGDISECFKCGGGSVNYGYSNCKNWIEYRWQPNFQKWSPYSEQDEYRGYAYMIDYKLYTAEVFDQDRERSAAMLNREMPEDPKLKENRLRQALVQAYYNRIHHLGAMHRMEELRDLLGR